MLERETEKSEREESTGKKSGAGVLDMEKKGAAGGGPMKVRE